MRALDPRYEEVHRELAEHRGSKPPGEAFELAIEKNVIAEYLQGEILIDELSAQVDAEAHTIQKLAMVRKRSRSSTTAPPVAEAADHRAHALVRILALEAAADDAVAAFRREHVGPELLDITDVAAWLERTAAIDDPPTSLITLPEEALRRAVSPDDPDLNRLPGYREEVPRLHFVADEAGTVRAIDIRLDGVLNDLAVISERIARRYDWDKAETTTLILTGVTPAPRTLQARTIDPWPWPQPRKRIEFDVPLNTKPDELAALYRRLRDEMLGDEPIGRKSLKKRSADLAVFAAEHSSGHIWNEVRAMWNHQHRETKDDMYTDTNKFVRDSRAAYKRIAGKDLDWTGKGPGNVHSPGNTPKET